jgi:hypothetical protein
MRHEPIEHTAAQKEGGSHCEGNQRALCAGDGDKPRVSDRYRETRKPGTGRHRGNPRTIMLGNPTSAGYDRNHTRRRDPRAVFFETSTVSQAASVAL